MESYEPERTRRRRNSISRDEIVRVARGIAESEGAEALTIRAVASAIGSAPMSLYNHVATKEALLDAVLDEVLGDLRVGDSGRDWRDELVAFAFALADHLGRHGWAVIPLMSRPDPGEKATALGEVPLAIALRGGLRPAVAVTAFASILALVYGRAAFIAAAARAHAQTKGEVDARIMAAMAEQYPATASVAAELQDYASREHLERGVRALVDGLSRA